MGIELNQTLNSFVKWANLKDVGSDSFVHATSTSGTDGTVKVAINDKANDGHGN